MTSPLSKYYRNKISGMQLKLPSDGVYGGDIDFSISGDVEIYALSAADEIYISNPDNLVTGAAVEKIIESSCPAVKDVRNLPIQDVDVICLASKKQTYGNMLKIGGKCKKCEKEQMYQIHIDGIFGKSTSLPKEMICKINEINNEKVNLKIYVKPYTLEIMNYINIKEFEENKFLDNIQQSDIPDEEKIKNLFNSAQKIKELNLNLLNPCIIRIVDDELEITNKNEIDEFMRNVSSNIVHKINDKIKEFGNYGLPKTYKVRCEDLECRHEQEIPLVYDPSNFFD